VLNHALIYAQIDSLSCVVTGVLLLIRCFAADYSIGAAVIAAGVIRSTTGASLMVAAVVAAVFVAAPEQLVPVPTLQLRRLGVSSFSFLESMKIVCVDGNHSKLMIRISCSCHHQAALFYLLEH
jgi:hypothetical protein